MTHPTQAHEVLAVLERGVAELSESALGWGDFCRVDNASPSQDLRVAATIELEGDIYAAQLAIATDFGGRQVIAAAMLDEPEPNSLSDEDLQDAMNEFMNLLAGFVKHELVVHDEQLAIGLLSPVEVTALTCRHEEYLRSQVRMGCVSADLIVIPRVPFTNSQPL